MRSDLIITFILWNKINFYFHFYFPFFEKKKFVSSTIYLFILNFSVSSLLLETVDNEHNTVLNKARKSKPELVVDDVISRDLRLLELVLINSTKDKVKNHKNSKTIKINK